MRKRCCRYCVPPRRHVGCHAACEDYQKEMKANEERYEARAAEHRVWDDLDRVSRRNKRRK